MIEAHSICTAYRYHKHKLVLVLSAMREYRDSLRKKGYAVEYVELSPGTQFLPELAAILKKHGITHLKVVTPEDRTAAQMLRTFASDHSLQLTEYESPMFVTSRALGEQWLAETKHPVMENFYRWQRRRLGILMREDKPVGEVWNFDAENRKPLPKAGLAIPQISTPAHTTHVKHVSATIDALFPDHPGKTADFWLPVTRSGALEWLDEFILERLPLFGTYEDAMAKGEAFLFHSVLSPLLNIGLLTPEEVVRVSLQAHENNTAPLHSVEGFIRQIIGWREYMRAVYWHKTDLKTANFFGFTKNLEDWWYTKEYQHQDLPVPLLEALHTVHRYGYNHHIERLMVLGNWFLLNEYNPQSVFAWFQSMYVDAYEWVMVPNVQGMSQYADGGYVATKPYISGGNYLEKMGRWWGSAAAAKESEYTKKYWEFLRSNREKLAGNHRMAIALKAACKN